jgi:multidrug resistance efflux pump
LLKKLFASPRRLSASVPFSFAWLSLSGSIVSDARLLAKKDAMQTKKYGSLLALSLLLTGGLFSGCSGKREGARPQYRALTESVYASGRVQPRHEYKVFATVDGYLVRRRVDEGDTVRAGEPLFDLESEKQNIVVRNARANYRTAAANAAATSPVLEELAAALQSARARMQNDSVNFVRYRNLYEQNATSRMEYDRAALAYRTSCNDYKVLASRYRNTQTSLADNLRNARTQYQLDAEVQSDYQVRSRIDGKVYELYREEGELVKRGEPVALLGDPSGVYLKLGIDELDIHKVQRGQSVLVKLDSYPDRVFGAVVEKIYPMLNARDRTFAADARFTDTLPGTYAGLTAEANIVIRRSPRALSIPRAYLVGADSVAVERDGEVRTLRIRKGVQNMEYVEVLAGLDATDVLVKR